MSKSFILLILVAGLFVACKKSKDSSSTAGKNPSSASSGNPVTAPADYLGALGKGKRSADATLETASINKAVQLFYAQEGRFPKDLKELNRPEYLPQMPQPPAGMKFDYNPRTGEVKIVSQ
jgi:hypothetical protein